MSEKFTDRFAEIAGTPRSLDQGSYLFHQGDQVRSIFLIDVGLVELTRHQEDGASIVLQRATDQTVLAEASAYSNNYHCDAVVKAPTRLMTVPKSRFLKQIQCDEAFSNLWAAHLAGEVQASRYRSEILARRTVADRLDGWLVWQGQTLPPKGQWKSLADQIGVSPEALYRELAKRQLK